MVENSEIVPVHRCFVVFGGFALFGINEKARRERRALSPLLLEPIYF